MRKHILLVVNPISGDKDKTELINKTRQYIQECGGELEIFRTTGSNDEDQLYRLFHRTEFERILVAGGDGTIQLVASALRGIQIPIAILVAGSANALALNLNLPKILDDQLSVALLNNFLDMDVLCIGDHICIHIADLGVNAELIRKYEKSRYRGKLGYLIQVIPTLIEAEYPIEVEIDCNGVLRKTSAALIAIANGRRYGTGATINPNGKLNDGIFELVLFKSLNVIEILKTLNDDFIPNPEVVEIIQTTKALIRTKVPSSFQIDGEYIGELEQLSVTLAEYKIRMVIPA